jgi:glycosyltransferase involved in cell wall biosynthesis
MGGGQAFALRLCRWLRTAEPEREVRLLSAGDGELARRAAAGPDGVEVVDAAFPPPLGGAVPSPRAAMRIRSLLARAPGDAIVVANSARVQAYAVPIRPTVRSTGGLVSLMHERESARRLPARLALRAIGAVAAVGESGAGTYAAALWGKPVAKVTNFLSPDEFEQMARRRAAAPGGRRPVVGVLSRMCRGKGIVELVEELADHPNSWERLLVAAPFQEADYVEAVRERCRLRSLTDRVELLGAVSPIEGFLASIDFLVVPSVASEAMPTVILEGLACGRPVLVRSHIWTHDYEGLPVERYSSGAELAQRLAEPAPAPVGAEELSARFHPATVVETLERIAR